MCVRARAFSARDLRLRLCWRPRRLRPREAQSRMEEGSQAARARLTSREEDSRPCSAQRTRRNDAPSREARSAHRLYNHRGSCTSRQICPSTGDGQPLHCDARCDWNGWLQHAPNGPDTNEPIPARGSRAGTTFQRMWRAAASVAQSSRRIYSAPRFVPVGS